MKIGFDTSQTGRPKTGCGYFADGLIRQLTADDNRNEYILYSAVGDLFWDPEYAPGTFASNRADFHRWKAPADFDVSRRFWCNPGQDFELRLGAPDIFHSNSFFCPRGLKHARLVYTLYDLSFVQHPEWSKEENRAGYFSGVFRARLHADLILAISEYTRQHFLATFPGFPASRIVVVYPASRFDGSCGTPAPERFANLKPGGFWLSVSTIEPRKNYGRLLDAYRMLKAQGSSVLPLVLAGGQGWLMQNFDALLHGLDPGREIILPGYVSDDELKWLYKNCFGFVVSFAIRRVRHACPGSARVRGSGAVLEHQFPAGSRRRSGALIRPPGHPEHSRCHATPCQRRGVARHPPNRRIPAGQEVFMGPIGFPRA
jgi:glycosyltransferase involved in cell wall biosynthesis